LSFLLDTNAISEPGRPRPDPSFEYWFSSIEEAAIFLSVVTLGELRHGVAMLADGARRRHLEGLHLTLMRRYESQILPVDLSVALAWGELAARHRSLGRRPSVTDELIAATAQVHDLVVVTRNISDFEASGCRIVCPWSD
jgi:predicted nucleic acid-binding protein